VRAQARGAAREKEARTPFRIRQQDDGDRRRAQAVRRGGAPRERREMLAGPRAQRVVEAFGGYRRLE
jgi:hypothetical protein